MLEAPLSAGNSSRSRRTLTFVGLLLVISLAAGVSSYIDCISVGYWNDLLDVGSAAMMVQGEGIANRVGDIEDIQGVSAAAALAGAECNLRMDQDEFYVNDPLAPNFLLVGRSYSLSQDYKQDFPDEFVLIEGRWPETETEIAITPTVADQANVGIGALMNYSIELNVGKRPVYVVGIYRQLMSSSFDYYYNSIAVVLQQLLHPEEIEFTVNVAVDRGILNPWSPQDTLSKLVAIERSIIALYPGYPEEVLYSEYHVTNDLAIGVNDYIEWIGHTKLAQVFRSQGLLILTGLFSSLILQYNFEARETELWMHCARGASRQRENRRVVGEVVFLSLLAIFPGLLIGQFILARLAYAAEGFFRINASQYFEAPILFTLDTVLFSILVAVFVPLITYGLITSLQTGESSTEMERSRLGRITKITRLVRWDAALLLIGSLILVSLGFGRVDVRNSPILTIVLSFLPAVFFVAAASLARKALSKFPNLLSKVFAFFFAFQSAKLGIRRFGRNAKSTIILVLLFSATLTLTISSATVANSMPITQLNHARFAIGSDVTFHLSKSKYSSWPDFIGNVTENEHVEALAQVSVGTVYLSEGRHGGVPFIAATPSSFINVGYDENGNRLSESYMGQLLMELNSSQSSAIITEDVASDYDLKQGDLLRSFALGEEDETMEFEILAIIPVLPAPMIPSSTSLDSNDIVGRMRVWFNIDTVPTEISLIDWTDTYLCLRVEESANGTMVAEEILSEWENDILHLGEWASVCHELDTYLERESFNLDLAVDTLVLTTSYVFIIVALIINEISRRRAQERENALLRSMGASSYDLAKSNLMEATGFVIYGLLLVALLCPLLVSNSLEIALNAYPAWNFDFYIQVFPTIPWTLVLSLSMLASFVTYASYAASAFISQSIDFSDALDAKWADYPYGGVMA